METQRPIKKLTDKEASDLRDQAAIAALKLGTGMSSDYEAKKAYEVADRLLEHRVEGRDVIDMPCKCNEARPQRVIPVVEPSDRQKLNEGVEANFKETMDKMKHRLEMKRQSPPKWFLWVVIVVVFLASNAVWYLAARFLGWLARLY